MVSKSDFIIREICPGCNSQNCQTIYSCGFLQDPVKEYLENYYLQHGEIEFDYLKEADYVLEECKDCGLIYQKQILNDNIMTKLYEEWIDPKKNYELHDRVDNLDYYSAYANEIMMIIAYFDRIPSQLRLLDYGMGWGKWARLAKAFGCESYGTEIAESKIDHANQCGIKVIDLNAKYYDYFDFINVDQVLEHVGTPLETIVYLKKFLKPNGIMKISVPDGWDIKKRLAVMDWKANRGTEYSLNKISPLEHVNCFNHSALIKMTHKAGYNLVEIPMKLKLLYCFYDLFTNFEFSKQNILKYRYRYYSFTRGTFLFLSQEREELLKCRI